MCKSRQDLTATIYDKRGRILAVGKNSYTKTHPVQKFFAERVGLKHKIFLHAEIAAISKCKNIKKADKIVITRYNKVTGEPILAKPCPVCEEAIKYVGIKKVEHT